MDRIMIVDMLNMYYRAYIVDPSLSSNGQPIGGIKGSLKILQKLCREVKPSKVYICWDGREGSSKRRKTIKEYKEGRKPIRLNRGVRNLSEEQELQLMNKLRRKGCYRFLKKPFTAGELIEQVEKVLIEN